MISENTVAKIIDAVQIEEVVSDFVNLKKRGANYTACCPFHNEKTPSFSVAPAKGIYKCFGCGNAGNAVKFVMEHEAISYPDALRYLAKQYNIEVEEVGGERSIEEKQERDSLFIVNDFAAQHWQKNLLETDEGKNVGLSYFKQRGFNDQVIEKFRLGYALAQYDTFLNAATDKGYKLEYLQKLGLTKTKNGRGYDFFRGRVQFPIFSLSGKVIAFGGRTLRTDKKVAKYMNSPETEIYHKSNVLYGLNFAKKSIRQQDECLLVEGYTDVISLHQFGIENVVSSSGTSLTVQQIGLVKRFTENVTMLFDGDAAGLKAALRGVDMILEQGLNVKIVVLPDGQDPDSFVREMRGDGFRDFVKANAKDFITFKTDLLLSEVADGDTVGRAAMIQDVVNSIAKIDDAIKQSLYVQQCAQMMNLSENVILSAMKKGKKTASKKVKPVENVPVVEKVDYQENEIMRCLLEFSELEISGGVPVSAYIVSELEGFKLFNPVHDQIIDIYRGAFEDGEILTAKFFVNHPLVSINAASASLIAEDVISKNWELKHGVLVDEKATYFEKDMESALGAFKMSRVREMMQECLDMLEKETGVEAQRELQETYMTLMGYQKDLSQQRKIVIC